MDEQLNKDIESRGSIYADNHRKNTLLKEVLKFLYRLPSEWYPEHLAELVREEINNEK